MKMNKILTTATLAAAIIGLEGCKFVSINISKMAELMEKRSADKELPEIGESESSEFMTSELDDATFTGIACSGGYDVVYTPGEFHATLSGPKAYMEHLILECNDGTLSVKTDGTKFKNWKNVKLSISSPTLSSISVAGAIDFKADYGVVSNDDFKVDIAGAGDMTFSSLSAKKVDINISGAGEMDVKGLCCNDIKAVVNGAGSITLAGIADSLDLSVNGAAEVDLRKLSCKQRNIHKAGIARVRE